MKTKKLPKKKQAILIQQNFEKIIEDRKLRKQLKAKNGKQTGQ